MPKQTVRFWVYTNGPVLLKMHAGQTLHHSYGGSTDEGYSYTGDRYHFDGDIVHVETTTRALDCDGRIDHYSEAYCSVTALRSGYAEPCGAIVYPLWRPGQTSQRDYSAEAMGY